MNKPAKLSALRRFFLHKYEGIEFVAQYKARYQLYLLIFAFCTCTFYLVRNIIVIDIIANDLLYFLAGALPLLLLLAFVLRSGHYLVSGHGLILISEFLVWFDSFLQPYQLPYIRLDNIALVLGLLVSAALLTNMKGLLFHFALNFTLLMLFWQFGPEMFEISDDVVNSFAIDATIGLVITTASALLYTYISRRAQKMSEELNVTLEQKVNERTDELNQALHKLDEQHKELQKSHYFMEVDRALATRVQNQFLRIEPPRLTGYDLAVHFQPLAGVSGDFYDFYHDGQKLQGIGLFDVSGHGVASGLITMLAKKAIFRSFLDNPQLDLEQVMKKANQELLADIGDMTHYLSGVLLRLAGGNMVHYVNAGHVPLLKRDGKSGQVAIISFEDFKNHGPYLGIAGTAQNFPMLEIEMNPGDTLLLCSDGITEPLGSIQENIDMKQTGAIFSDLDPTEPVDQQMQSFMSLFYERLAGKSIEDDITMIMVQKARV